MLDHLRPHYAAQFRCIGSDCEDTCCHGLDVVIDQTAYGKFQSLRDFDTRLRPHLVVLPTPTEARHARIQLTPEYSCPFLTAERMCGVQQDYGEFYLADICATYPRLTQRIDGLRETTLLLSCPEAARLVLLNSNLLPEESDAGRLPRYHQFAGIGDAGARANIGSNRSPHQYLWDIRAFTLLLIRDRNYPLWQRLFLLGVFSKRLDEVTTAGELSQVPALLHDFAETIVQGKLRPSMDAIPVRSALQLGVVLEILDRHLVLTDSSHGRFRECVQDLLAGIHYDAGAPMEQAASRFDQAYTSYYQPFVQANPHFLENYLINYVLRTRFPYGVDSEGTANLPLTEFLLLSIFFSTIKTLLIGMAGKYRETFDANHAIKAVQSFTKAVEQAPKFAGASYRGLATLDGMALLLKN